MQIVFCGTKEWIQGLKTKYGSFLVTKNIFNLVFQYNVYVNAITILAFTML